MYNASALASNAHTEFFAGIGGTSLGLAAHWQTIWATDICEQKASIHRANHPSTTLKVADIADITPLDVPPSSLASVTFPCTNTSCAGGREGLLGIKSGVIHRYLDLLRAQGGAKAVPMTFLENPTGLIARNQGQDLRDLVRSFNDLGYRVNLSVIDAKHFVPQSRPRLFIVCMAEHLMASVTTCALPKTHNEAYSRTLVRWLSNNPDLDLFAVPLPAFPTRDQALADVIEFDDSNAKHWATPEFEQELISLMSDSHKVRFDRLVASPTTTVSTISRRGRTRKDGSRFNSTEIGSSQIAPCQRPYKGGSSRTWVLIAGQGRYRIKVISPRESARLMGLPDTFWLPDSERAAYSATGDAVVPQAVAWLDQAVLQPIIQAVATNTQPIKVPHLSYMDTVPSGETGDMFDSLLS